MKGRNFNTMICAMYFIASRKLGMSKSFKEINKMFGIEEKKIKKAYNYIKTVVVNSISPEQLNETIFNYIRTFCDSNGNSNGTMNNNALQNLASTIARNINETSLLEGRNTKTITGLSLILALQLVGNDNITKELICKEFGTENTMHTSFEKICGSLDKIIPQEYQSKMKSISI